MPESREASDSKQSKASERSRGRGPTLAKDINRKRVYQLIKQRRSTSRVEVAKLLHLNKNTVNSIVDEMLANGFVLEHGPQTTSTAGRKPILLGFNACNKWSIGVQLTSTVIHWAITDMYAKPLSSFSMSLESASPESMVKALVSGIEQIARQHRLSDCIGICVGIPGLIEAASGIVIQSSHLEWHHVSLLDMLRNQVNIRLQLDNSVKLASLGELWHGAGQGLDNFIYCNFGNGVGCSIMINGTIVRGDRNAAGELGHFVVNEHGPICRCGNTGCLEAWVSLPSIMERISDITGIPKSVMSMDWIVSEFASGNKVVIDEITQAGHYIGKALSYVTNLLNPKLIICDGPLMQASQHLFPLITEQIRKGSIDVTFDHLLLKQSGLFPLASCIGAAASVIQAWEEDLVTFESTT